MKYVQLKQPMEKLYKLQLSFNGLKSIDLSQFPGLRTIYLDDNLIHRIIGINCLSRIESFSIRDQGGNKL
jgi:Leucine-rich repeat (LRR) protein